ncbi:uncharacterized protein BO87DRAFT_19299 [Aspergillus neoniger CBS 115656]|uniref:Uncharacterized protein n=1 Tax=Aspergillus neoniger (strain CBS 115656) TaxID=1448310 RepID=A0A318YQL9_ASPNB|nr:hypothetical protein BO87DRAFT_19299 [Aspergillus neoniger CBS 115656]PYH36197.1 hypothetical protein BO87DRAFT_19299 [Aspergillus neoniger CBS 115656]
MILYSTRRRLAPNIAVRGRPLMRDFYRPIPKPYRPRLRTAVQRRIGSFCTQPHLTPPTPLQFLFYYLCVSHGKAGVSGRKTDGRDMLDAR